MAIVINPSVNINIVYSTEHDYRYLINEGIASQGDLIIEGISNDGNGVIHIQDTDFYLSGFAIYKNGKLVNQSQASYIKSNTENTGDIGFTGIVSANNVSSNTVSFSKLAYNKTGKELARIIEGMDNIPWRIVFDRNVIPMADDFIIDGRYFSKTYISHTDTSLLFQSKDEAHIQKETLESLIYDTCTNIYTTIDSVTENINSSINIINSSIDKLKRDIYNVSTYYYTEPRKLIESPQEVKSVQSALDTLLSDKFYTYPEDVSVICSVSPSTFIKGKRISDGIKFSWRMINYITEAQHRSYTRQTYDGLTTNNLYTYTQTISATEVVNATDDIRRTLVITNNFTDSHGNQAKPFEYEFVAKMIVEEYYFCSVNENISNTTSYINSLIALQPVVTEDGYKKIICEIGDTPQYVFLVLENTNMPAFYLYDSDDQGILGDKSLEGGIKLMQTISFAKYNKTLTYTLYRTSQKLTGNICIQYK